jgi:homoserine dehydrogenase
MEKPELVIGLFGFGVVGEGLYHVLENSKTVNARIKQICIRNPEKERSLPADFFTTEASKVLEDKEINLFVELIDDPLRLIILPKLFCKAADALSAATKKCWHFTCPSSSNFSKNQWNTSLRSFCMWQHTDHPQP